MKRVLLTSAMFALLFTGMFMANAESRIAYADHTNAHRAQECEARGGYFDDNRCNFEPCSNSFLGLPTWYKYLGTSRDASGCHINMPVDSVTGETDVAKTVSYIAVAVVEILLRIATLVAVGFIIYGGIKFILSQGDPENAKTARQTVINALIGLVISLAAAAIVSFIANRLTS